MKLNIRLPSLPKFHRGDKELDAFIHKFSMETGGLIRPIRILNLLLESGEIKKDVTEADIMKRVDKRIKEIKKWSEIPPLVKIEREGDVIYFHKSAFMEWLDKKKGIEALQDFFAKTIMETRGRKSYVEKLDLEKFLSSTFEIPLGIGTDIIIEELVARGYLVFSEGKYSMPSIQELRKRAIIEESVKTILRRAGYKELNELAEAATNVAKEEMEKSKDPLDYTFANIKFNPNEVEARINDLISQGKYLGLKDENNATIVVDQSAMSRLIETNKPLIQSKLKELAVQKIDKNEPMTKEDLIRIIKELRGG